MLWFRRDLRLADNPALRAAIDAADEVLALFVWDPVLCGPAGPSRLAFLHGCVRALDADLDGGLVTRTGRPEQVVAQVARSVSANSVHVAADHGPYGRDRDERVARALGDIPLVRTGSAYAVPPGEVGKPDGTAYQMFTPYSRAWAAHAVPAPSPRPRGVRWSRALRGDRVPDPPPLPTRLCLPPPGERAARALWRGFLSGPIEEYDRTRDRPDLDATSRLSPYLRFGCLHPRTLLADLAEGQDDRAGCALVPGAEAFRRQLVWREFYADLLHHRPRVARENLLRRLSALPWDTGRGADELFDAWAAGRTGYPIVDAGMRQLRSEGWMHNRVRLITASFLVKDLHLHWRRGARHFLYWLVDGDLASNQCNWQWVAGTATEAAPFHRVFNPVTQGRKFDRTGDYVRRHVPELRRIDGRAVHEPWALPDGPPQGYPARVVDHTAERDEALRRYRATRA